MTRAKAWAIGSAIFGITVVLDWITKILAEAHLDLAPVVIVPRWLSFRLAYNRGVAFSAFESLPHWMLGVGAIVLLGIVIWGLRGIATRPAGLTALSLVAAGGISNAIDRLADGRVTDMISMTPWWPVFNIADTAITIGVALLFLATRKEKAAAHNAAASSDAAEPPTAA